MQNKLKEVASPSSSKDEDDEYYNEDGDEYNINPDDISQSDITGNSIPMAHREYEKILR
jgi:hypothetical protein